MPLSLKRKPGESVMIGHDIQVVVAKVRGDNVWLNFVAPRGVIILRAELYVPPVNSDVQPVLSREWLEDRVANNLEWAERFRKSQDSSGEYRATERASFAQELLDKFFPAQKGPDDGN